LVVAPFKPLIIQQSPVTLRVYEFVDVLIKITSEQTFTKWE